MEKHQDWYKKHIKNYLICALKKTRPFTQKKLHQLLQPPKVHFQKPALDFVIGLPKSQNPTTGIYYDMVCTIIDGLTKYVKFILCKTTMITKKLIRLFLKKIFADQAFPNKSLLTKINCSRRNSTQNYEKFGMKKSMSTVFHPQTDGQIEWMNQTLEQYFRLFARNNKYKRVKLLPKTQIAISKSYNENLKQFPHETLYGTILKTIEIGPTVNQTTSKFAMKIKNNWVTIGTKITRARQKKKKKKKKKKKNQKKTFYY